jgi:energy-coupling factor transporter ATP-binding protein EcfA2
MEESNPPMGHEIGGYGEAPSSALVVASGILPGSLPATGADTRPRALLASASLVAPSSSPPSAAALASLGQHPGSVSAGSSSLSPGSTSGSAVIPTRPPSRFFTTSSGDRVLLRQSGGEWQALLHQGVGGYAHRRTLPVVSSGDIGASLEALQGQDAWSSRSRIHVLSAPHASSAFPTSCVYVGRLGLLGGMPRQQAPSSAKEEWRPAHTMILASGEARTEVCHIQPGYRYKGYRLKSDPVIQRASLTIRYVEANNEEDIRRLEAFNDGSELAAKLSADFGQVVTLGTFEGGIHSSSNKFYEDLHVQRTKHAGLVLFGKTKKDKLLRQGGRIDVQLEICVEKTQDSPQPPVPASNPPRPMPPAPAPVEEDVKLSPRPTPPIAPVPSPGPVIDSRKVRSLLEKKLADPTYSLSESESIALLTLCVSDGAENAKKISGKDAVIVIGNTGAGKSTFVNYLLGCDMIQKTPKELGIKGLKKVVVVRPKSEGGACDEVMLIGHSKTSKTFIPQIASDPISRVVAYCDCPGFLDNRGAEINIANAVNIKRALQEAKCVKVLILINYHSLLADRGRGLTDMLSLCTQLFGSTANLKRFQEALLLGVTQVPEDIDIDSLREWLLEDTPDVMQVLSRRLFLYDPLNRGGSDFWSRDQCAFQLAALQGIPQSQSCNIFQTVLTADDEQKLVEIVEKQSKTLKEALDDGSYAEAGSRWQALQRLGVIDNIRVERMLHLVQLRLQHVVSRRVAMFRECVVHYDFDEAQKHLSALRAMGSHFHKADLELDLSELERHRVFFQKKQCGELADQRRYREAQERYASDTKKLLAVIESQKQEMESRLSTLLSDHVQETSKLRVEMIRRGEAYDEQIAKLREESTASLRKQEEMQSLNQALSSEERAKLQAAQSQLARDYEAKLAAAEREKAEVRSEYDALLAAQQEAQKQSQLALQAQLAQLSAQQETKKAELSKISIPSMAFGAKAWKDYFGVEVGTAPLLPANIDAILNGPCPFWPGKLVKDTHLLVLVPATVDGKPFTLDLLGDLIKSPQGGDSKTQYTYYSGPVKEELGAKSPGGSYWVLMTRDVLPGSRIKTYDAQKEMVAAHASRLGLPYEMPDALSAATAILVHHVRTGERLYTDAPLTYTRCQNKVDKNSYPVFVGGFSSGGLGVCNDYDVYDGYGVSCLRKF